MGGVIQTFGVVHESPAIGAYLFPLAPEGAQGSWTLAVGAVLGCLKQHEMNLGVGYVWDQHGLLQ